MRRFHLFELEDQQWFPSFIRDYGTDFLQFIANRFDFYGEVIPVIEKGIEKSGTQQVIDLASGGGGPWKGISARLKKSFPALRVLLTDFYPNFNAFETTKSIDKNIFDFVQEPVNALNVPSSLSGLRTMFLSFHHFMPDDAKKILQNAVENKNPVAIFEAQQRDLAHFIRFLFTPLGVLIFTPFIRPFSVGRIFFTYFFPVVPFFVLWDGLVSVLRTYTVEEMKKMTEEIPGGEYYKWESEKIPNGPITIIYLLGFPKDE